MNQKGRNKELEKSFILFSAGDDNLSVSKEMMLIDWREWESINE